MEYPCYQCHSPVLEGKVFCPECRAPLIRVILPEPVAPRIEAPEVETTRDTVHYSANVKNPRVIDWSQAVPSVALAGVISSALMIFPFGAFGPAMLAAGALAVIFYHRRTPSSEPTYGIGAKLGALGGVIGFAIFTVFTAIVTLFSGIERLRTFLIEAVNQSASRANDPQAIQVYEYFKTPVGLTIILAFVFVFLFFMFVVLSIAGSALGTAWVRRRRRY